jgi:hypothetical protein|tara:strand:+ start:405 stop:512 length:108 start_codon:yes stop_codon:yes gene_type:complete
MNISERKKEIERLTLLQTSLNVKQWQKQLGDDEEE